MVSSYDFWPSCWGTAIRVRKVIFSNWTLIHFLAFSLCNCITAFQFALFVYYLVCVVWMMMVTLYSQRNLQVCDTQKKNGSFLFLFETETTSPAHNFIWVLLKQVWIGSARDLFVKIPVSFVKWVLCMRNRGMCKSCEL